MTVAPCIRACGLIDINTEINFRMTNFDELFEQMQDSDREVGDRLRRHLQFFFMNPMEKWSVSY